MNGFKPGSFGTGSDRAINCATTTALSLLIVKANYFGVIIVKWHL